LEAVGCWLFAFFFFLKAITDAPLAGVDNPKWLEPPSFPSHRHREVWGLFVFEMNGAQYN
jgi:hypothetical protein